MTYVLAAVEQAMTRQEAILRALSGRQPWLQVADVLGVTARTVRRLRWRYEHYGYDGLFDRRRRRPSPRCAPVEEVQRVLRLYREHYVGFNARHFYDIARRQHELTLSYSFVKQALQGAGLLPKHRPRGRHRRRREPRPCFGELLHLDGSRHHWLALVPDLWLTLIVVVDDATKRLLYAQFAPGGESSAAVMTALRAVFQTYGLPIALYTDRAHWAVHTPTSGAAPDRTKPTQLGRALQRLGIEHILGYSPQARGRSERANRTLQGRLVNELRLAGITTPQAANAYLREHFLAAYDTSFARPPADPASAFVPLGSTDLEQILCHEEARVVGRDNTVAFDSLTLQIDKQRGRRSCAGLRVLVRRHLTGQHSIWCGPRRFGLYDAQARPLSATGDARPPQRRTNHVSKRSRAVLALR
jgi:transposase